MTSRSSFVVPVFALLLAACSGSGGGSDGAGSTTTAARSGKAATTTTAPAAPARPTKVGAEAWSLARPLEGSVTVVEDQVMIDGTGYEVEGLPDTVKDGDHVFATFDVGTGTLTTVVVRKERTVHNGSGVLGSDALLAADIVRTTTPASGLDEERTTAAVTLWDLATGKQAWSVDLAPPAGETAGREPPEATILSVSKASMVVRVENAVRRYDVETGKVMWEQQWSTDVLAPSPDGRLLARVESSDQSSFMRQDLVLVDLATGTDVGRVPAIAREVAWASDDVLWTTASGAAVVFSASPTGLRQLFEAEDALPTVLVDDEGETVVVGQTDAIAAVDVATAKVRWTREFDSRRFEPMALRDGKLIGNASGSKDITDRDVQGVILDPATGRELSHYDTGFVAGYRWWVDDRFIGIAPQDPQADDSAATDGRIHAFVVDGPPAGVDTDGRLVPLSP